MPPLYQNEIDINLDILDQRPAGVERQADAVMDIDQIAAAAPKDVEIPAWAWRFRLSWTLTARLCVPRCISAWPVAIQT
ncbi:hypothetical protein [Bradyrhizobium sp. USDA 3364]